MYKSGLSIMVLSLVCPLWIASPALAQSEEEFAIKEASVQSSGGTSFGGEFALRGTIGESHVAKLSGGPFSLKGGFTPGAAARPPDSPLFKRISVAPGADLDPAKFLPRVTLEQPRNERTVLVIQTFSRVNGLQVGATFRMGFPFGSDVLLSTVFRPGSVLVLDLDRRVYVFPLRFAEDGTPLLGKMDELLGPIGDDALGQSLVLGEAPNADDISLPFLGLGTELGFLVIASNETLEGNAIRLNFGFPVTDVGGVADRNYFSLLAVCDGVGFGVHPDVDPGSPGIQPELSFSAVDPRETPLLDFGAPLLSPDSDPASATSAELVTANGTREVTVLKLPDSPGIGDAFRVGRVDVVGEPVSQVVLGSLTFVPSSGNGLIYNKAYTVANGIAGRLWTIGGASMAIDAHAPGSQSQDHNRYITLAIEADNHRITEIVPKTLTLAVSGVDGIISAHAHPAPDILDYDGDTNLDLLVRFDRRALDDLLGRVHFSNALLCSSWKYLDGSTGEACTASINSTDRPRHTPKGK